MVGDLHGVGHAHAQPVTRWRAIEQGHNPRHVVMPLRGREPERAGRVRGGPEHGGGAQRVRPLGGDGDRGTRAGRPVRVKQQPHHGAGHGLSARDGQWAPGREGGEEGLAAFLESKTIVMDTPAS